MNYVVQEWLNLVFRWVHVFAGIMWVGATYYFTWLDRRFHTTDPDQVWMVHSGGFYVVNKTKKPSPEHTLHWFKWEAAITWISGLLLLILVYYFGGLLVSEQNFTTAAIWGVGVLLVGWKLYDLLWLSPLPEPLLIAISYAALVGLAWWLPHVMSPRAAYMHIGALMGTAMAANVWERIIPAQKKMVADVAAGREPNQVLADRAKFRSKHNTYIVWPVVLIMMNGHFPIAMRGYDWKMMAIFIVVGWAIAHVIRKH